jgi:hypothetical protein
LAEYGRDFTKCLQKSGRSVVDLVQLADNISPSYGNENVYHRWKDLNESLRTIVNLSW